jgi:hypothetical protein
MKWAGYRPTWRTVADPKPPFIFIITLQPLQAKQGPFLESCCRVDIPYFV